MEGVAIQVLPHEILLRIFSKFNQVQDLCAVAGVCREWRSLLAADDKLSLNQKRLNCIAFHRIDQLDQLPRETFELSLRSFTLFRKLIIGETTEGNLIIYDYHRKKLFPLDFTPPFESEYPGKFLTSTAVCVFRFSRSYFYRISVKKKKCKRLNFKQEFHSDVTLLGKRLICWKIQPLLVGWFRDPRRNAIYPFIEMQIFDLKDKHKYELTLPTRHSPRIYPQKQCLLVRDKRWIHVFDENMKELEPSTFWLYEARRIHLVGKKLLFEGSKFGSFGTQSYVGVKDIGDNRNYGEEEYNLPFGNSENLHAFFLEGKDWKFLKLKALYDQYAFWFLEAGQLKSISLI